jgi:hypothetical protein
MHEFKSFTISLCVDLGLNGIISTSKFPNIDLGYSDNSYNVILCIKSPFIDELQNFN